MRGSLIAIVRSALLRRARAGSLILEYAFVFVVLALLNYESFAQLPLKASPTVRASAKDFATTSFIQEALRASSHMGVAMVVDEHQTIDQSDCSAIVHEESGSCVPDRPSFVTITASCPRIWKVTRL